MTETITLNHQTSRTLQPCPPFHFDGTVWKPSYFPGTNLAYAPGCLWQSLRFAGGQYGLRLENLGSIDAPAVRLVIFSPGPLAEEWVEQITAEVAFRYDLYSNLRDFYDDYGPGGAREDALLAPALARWRGTRPSSYAALDEYLVAATLLQNTTVRRTVQMSENLFARFGVQLAFDGRVLAGFWPPEAIAACAEEELRALKLGYRAKTLLRQAALFADGGVFVNEAELRQLSTPALKRELLKIYGVGPASVWYLLFGVFHRYEAFEYISPWEQKIFSRLMFGAELVEAGQILAEAERRWGRWKMLGAHLLFEDLFWQRRHQPEQLRMTAPWLEELIRL